MEWFDKWPERATNAKALRPRISSEDKTEVWIYRFTQQHGETYTYSSTKYTRAKDKVSITCNEHGEFLMLADNHARGQGCPSCRDCNKDSRHTTEDFILEALEVHGDRYDYSFVEYINAHAKVRIICPDHGEFLQSQVSHVRNLSECPKCRSKSSNIVYLFKCLDMEDTYKIGITNNKKVDLRMRQIEKSAGMSLECLGFKVVDNARELEQQLLKVFTNNPFSPGEFDGSTEFRNLNELEVLEICKYLEIT